MQTVVITGASQGVGYEFVRQYLEDGWKVIATTRAPSEAHDLIKLKWTDHQQLRIIPLEFSTMHQIEQIKIEIGATPVDLLINNASIPEKDADELGSFDFDRWSQTMQVNLFSPFHLIENLMSNLVNGQKKGIVNITCQLGSIGSNKTGGSYYFRTSKAALNMATKCAGFQLKEQKIPIIALHPGESNFDENVFYMRQIIASMTLEHTGGFYNFNGEPLPW